MEQVRDMLKFVRGSMREGHSRLSRHLLMEREVVSGGRRWRTRRFGLRVPLY
jgi:hypothetical protein